MNEYQVAVSYFFFYESQCLVVRHLHWNPLYVVVGIIAIKPTVNTHRLSLVAEIVVYWWAEQVDCFAFLVGDAPFYRFGVMVAEKPIAIPLEAATNSLIYSQSVCRVGILRRE